MKDSIRKAFFEQSEEKVTKKNELTFANEDEAIQYMSDHMNVKIKISSKKKK